MPVLSFLCSAANCIELSLTLFRSSPAGGTHAVKPQCCSLSCRRDLGRAWTLGKLGQARAYKLVNVNNIQLGPIQRQIQQQVLWFELQFALGIHRHR